MPSLPPDSQWIASAVQAPILAILAWMLHTLKRGLVLPPGDPVPSPSDRAAERNDRIASDMASDRAALERTRDDLAAFKLEVARTYVPLSLIRDVDSRLTAQLIRIEQKLDEATRAAHSTAAQLRVMSEDR